MRTFALTTPSRTRARVPATRWDCALIALALAGPALFTLAAFVIWPAPPDSRFGSCNGPTTAQTSWLHAIGVAVSVAVLVLCLAAWLRRELNRCAVGLAHVPWESLVVASALAALWWGHLDDVLLVYLPMVPGAVAAAVLVCAGWSVWHGDARLLLRAVWLDVGVLLPTLYVVAVLTCRSTLAICW